MKNKAFEALLILLIAGFMLVGFSYLVGQVNIPWINGKSLHIKFIDKKTFFDFTVVNNNNSADSLINNYMEDSALVATNLKLLNDQIERMSNDSIKILEVVNYKLNCFLSTDSSKNEKGIQKFIKNYLNDEKNLKKKIIKQEMLAYLNLKNIKNEFLVNPENNGDKALDKFFAYLMSHKETEIVRIAHYGDSQLEGDRVTSSLRNLLHARFGGSGLGFVPIIDNTDNVNLSRQHSENWKRYTVFHDKFYNSFYGIAGVVFRFGNAPSSMKDDESPVDSAASKNSGNDTEKKNKPKKKMKVKKHTEEQSQNDNVFAENSPNDTIKKTDVHYSNTAYVAFNLAKYVKYEKISLMYGRSKSPCRMNVYDGKEKIFSVDLPETNTFKVFDIDIPPNTHHFKLEFTADVSPDFYGLLLDGNHGVQIDNYALRGHSGDGLMLINSDYMALQIKQLNIRLIILQYGNNVVPYIKSEKMCKWLEGCYVDLLTKIKNASPNSSILLIGVGDMARKSEGESSSYPMIPKIRDAQKNAALKLNCAFWDLFESMGGLNSINTWCKNRLASKDGHLSTKGREIMAKEIFDALMIEYDVFRYKPLKKQA